MNHSTPLHIGIGFSVVSINKLSEIDETISISGSLALNWTDPALTWNPSLYDKIYSIMIDPKDMWTLPLFLGNGVDSVEPIGNKHTFWTRLNYTGYVIYYPGHLFVAKCPVDISKFPFDTQTCTLKFSPWGLNYEFLRVSAVGNKGIVDYLIPNSDWMLLDHSTGVDRIALLDIFSITLKLKRQPLYYSVMVIMPTLLFALLNPLVFMLPVESGERVGLAMTILLSYAIFLTLVSTSIPASSNPMCALLIIMMMIIMVSGAIVFGTILTSKILNRYHPCSDV